MSISSDFNLSDPSVQTLSSVVTDTTSGAITPVVKKINLATNAIIYLNTDGTSLNGTGVLSGTQVDKAEPVLMVTGSEILSDITTTVTSLTAIPANSGVAYGEVKDGDCIYTVDSTTPDITAGAEVGKRVPNGGRITLRGMDEITKFKVLSYDGVTAVDIDFEFKNAE